MPIEFTNEDKKTIKKKASVKMESIFAQCKKCDRPYHKGPNYPDEVCRFCEVESE